MQRFMQMRNNKKLTTLLHILKERLGLGPICVLNGVLIEFLFPLNQLC